MSAATSDDAADIYPVGVLSTLLTVGRSLRLARSTIRHEGRYLAYQARKGNWRAVRNSFNGYLAEHDGHPHNCGRGWTRRAAKRRVDRICAAALAGDDA